jgi:hypothetical protein
MNLNGYFATKKISWLRMGSGAGHSAPDKICSVAECVGGYLETESAVIF